MKNLSKNNQSLSKLIISKILPVLLLASMALSSLQINSMAKADSSRAGIAIGLASIALVAYKTYIEHQAQRSTNQALLEAINGRDTYNVKRWIANGADVNTVSKDGETALTLAIKIDSAHSINIVAQLLAAGAKVDTKNATGDTALMLATTSGHLDIITQLIDAGADVNVGNEKGETPLIEAAIYQNQAIITLLLEAGANVNAASKTGVTALTLTFPHLNNTTDKNSVNSRKIFQQLLAAGAEKPKWMEIK